MSSGEDSRSGGSRDIGLPNGRDCNSGRGFRRSYNLLP